MRCRIVFSFILTALFQVSAFAQNLNVKSDLLGDLDPNSKNSCFCEIGKQPENQQFFFTLGCEIWLARQYHCNYKAIVLEDTNYLTEAMPEDTNSFSIGYVGHWASSRQFIDYLNASILPLMHKRASSVFIDNTACDAMKDAESVSRFLNLQKFSPGQGLIARGNQATSIGTWDIVLPSSDNFTAEVSSAVDHVIYPKCRRYENHPCFDAIQKYETGYCMDASEKQIQLLCCPIKERHKKPQSPLLFNWQKPENCG